MTDYYRICRKCNRPSAARAKECEHCQEKMPVVEIFVSYAHQDEPLLSELNKHLKILQRTAMGMVWFDQRIGKGDEWEKELLLHMKTADIILLLISSDFIASDFCYSNEMTLAMARHQRHEACVIPVILRPTSWHNAPFAKLQALPKSAKSVTEWSNRDAAFLDITKGIEGVMKERFDQAPPQENKWSVFSD